MYIIFSFWGLFLPGATLSVSPHLALIMGGQMLTISGLCLTRGVDDLRCRFYHQQHVTQGYIEDINTAYCVTPMIMHSGQIVVEVSLDGGNNYDFSTNIFTGTFSL